MQMPGGHLLAAIQLAAHKEIIDDRILRKATREGDLFYGEEGKNIFTFMQIMVR